MQLISRKNYNLLHFELFSQKKIHQKAVKEGS